ncbi:MAG: zinc ribbon domain-containing protein, partial [Pseudomonadota bacterium]
MPMYTYTCRACGDFNEMAPLSQFDAPCTCPTCGLLSERNLLSVPQVSNVTPLTRAAHRINERASDSPKRSKALGLEPSGRRINSKALHRPDGT